MRVNRKKLICAMLDADINTKQLAIKAGISRATACSVKNGKSCCYETLVKMAGALKMEVAELIG